MTKLSGLTHARGAAPISRPPASARCPAAAPRCSPTACASSIAPGKEHPDIWIAMHRAAHGMGIPTHCTMLYDHVETYEERIDHLLRLRDLQDETGGFLAFIPLPFHPENTVFERRGWRFTTGYDDLKMHAVSRLMLDNIAHVKAYWIMISTPLAQVALHFGANDIQGTVVEETIAHAAGAVTPHRGEGRLARARDPRGRPRARAARHVLQHREDASRDPAARPHLVHQHGAGLLRPDRPRCRAGRRRPDRAQPPPRRGRDRRRHDLVDRVRAKPRQATCCCRRCASSTDGAVESVQLVTRRPLGGADGRRHARERDLRRPDARCSSATSSSSRSTSPPTRGC